MKKSLLSIACASAMASGAMAAVAPAYLRSAPPSKPGISVRKDKRKAQKIARRKNRAKK